MSAFDTRNLSGTSYIIPFDGAVAADFDRMGGKGASLARMTAAGVAVPAGFSVATDAYADMLRADGLGDEIAALMAALDIDDVADQARKSDAIRAAITARPVPEPVEQAIRAAYGALSARFGGDLPVAVRSSATAEDLPDASFAGQQDTYLWVVGADAVIDRVRACWASLFNARAIAYRAKNGLGDVGVLMSVAVQKMVDARSAGVAMTLDPVTGDRSRIVIDAAFGLGEPVVSGDITPDNFVLDKVLLAIAKRNVAHKDFELVVDRAARCTVERVIEAERRSLSSLSDAEIVAVARLAKALEKQMGCPQDVEWAIDRDLPEGENVVALQSRPETVWSRKAASRPKTGYVTGIEGVLGTLLSPVQTKQ
ncbi:phosphoenolpyruvate synthase [Kaistia dalseonensis]|uniref:Phosphoenolpyruvate synthase n=1 Tax=Kaistia dalseonensis TaxID=410840 RepID=A0ABU0HAY9_9HYPH|nr:PEP/pyruvate-binding domain-containing protein [Kaistia dalseonensis]MCX5496070.1 phosphoenolpyruvate synthase [Kaistia dalseonensis]MDQ0438674.1 pyruvate,water dikinase [Kaistia dalseonensis]